MVKSLDLGNSISDYRLLCDLLGHYWGFSFNYKMERILVSIRMDCYYDSKIMQKKHLVVFLHLPQHTNSGLFIKTWFGHHLCVVWFLTSWTWFPPSQPPHMFHLLMPPVHLSYGSQPKAKWMSGLEGRKGQRPPNSCHFAGERHKSGKGCTKGSRVGSPLHAYSRIAPDLTSPLK